MTDFYIWGFPRNVSEIIDAPSFCLKKSPSFNYFYAYFNPL